ncbi:MAG: nucleotide exchange factor GrpE [Caldilineaceae bacterium]
MEQENQMVEEVHQSDSAEKSVEETAAAESASNETETLITMLKQELEAEQAKVRELDDKLKRTIAESMNMRKRMDKQLADSIDRASAHIIGRLLPILDDLDLAFRNLPSGLNDEQSAWVGGFRQIQKKLELLLEEQNVVKFSDTGMLDPTRHEAILSEPHEQIESGHIIETIRPGYEQKGRIIRAALVKVAM